MKNERLYVILVFVFAIIFRLWFISLVPQPFIYDQTEYERYAAKMYNAPFLVAAHSYRSYPEPLLMAITYVYFGFGNHQALYSVHALLDAATAVFVYLILKKITSRRWVSWLGFLLYAVNPFTSGYVGVGLSEILDAFFITATIYCGMWFVSRARYSTAFLFGWCAGMAAQTRNAAFIWAAVPIGLSALFIRGKRWAIYTMVGIGFLVTAIYPVVTNWRAYREISITKVDSFYAMELFNGATLTILPPFTYEYPQAQQDMWKEYWSEDHPGRTTEERQQIARKYYQKAWDIIARDPVAYIRWRFFKMWYVWQKEAVFFYIEPGYETRRDMVYWGNIALLAFAALGIWRGRQFRQKEGRWVWAALVGTIVYTLVAFSFSHAEYRLTIPFYPLLIMLAALGVAG